MRVFVATVRASLVLLGCGVIAACGGGVDVTPTMLPPSSDTIPDISVNRAFSSLAFNRPVAMKQAPGDASRWFIAEKGGVIRVFANNEDSSSASVFLDISAVVNATNEGGLLGFAFDPDFPMTPDVYVTYTRSGAPLESYVSRFSSTDRGLTLNPASEFVILTVIEPATNHNIGAVEFGPGPLNLLYVGFGDGGSGAAANGQDTMNLHGSIIRIKVDSALGGLQYAVPFNNPFADNDVCLQGYGAADCPEIYAWGLRNPWRFSFDSVTGTLWAGDVGQNDWEEIDRVESGHNYGWDVREGTHCFNPANGCADTFTDPVTEYDHSLGGSVTGGYVYRGTSISDLIGWYIFGDFISGRIFAVHANSAAGVTPEELLDTRLSIVSFAEDNSGELYVLDYSVGTIHRVENAP